MRASKLRSTTSGASRWPKTAAPCVRNVTSRAKLNRTGHVVSSRLVNSHGVHVGFMDECCILDLAGNRLYDLKGLNIHQLSGERVGHFNASSFAEARLDAKMDWLFSSGNRSGTDVVLEISIS